MKEIRLRVGSACVPSEPLDPPIANYRSNKWGCIMNVPLS